MRNYSKKKAILMIVLPTLLVFGSIALFSLFFYPTLFFYKEERYNISAIIQSNSQNESLKTLFLAETLELSQDCPTNFYDFDVKSGKEKLLSTHVIENVEIKKVKPSLLWIEYQMRQPIAKIGDVTNTYVDCHGVLFPAFPFYTPKKIPELFLGEAQLKWGNILSEKKMSSLRTLLSQLVDYEVLKIDMSQSGTHALGRRNLVVVLKHGKGSHTLRLPSEGFVRALENYFHLNEKALLQDRRRALIDLRLPDMAFLKSL